MDTEAENEAGPSNGSPDPDGAKSATPTNEVASVAGSDPQEETNGQDENPREEISGNGLEPVAKEVTGEEAKLEDDEAEAGGTEKGNETEEELEDEGKEDNVTDGMQKWIAENLVEETEDVEEETEEAEEKMEGVAEKSEDVDEEQLKDVAEESEELEETEDVEKTEGRVAEEVKGEEEETEGVEEKTEDVEEETEDVERKARSVAEETEDVEEEEEDLEKGKEDVEEEAEDVEEETEDVEEETEAVKEEKDDVDEEKEDAEEEMEHVKVEREDTEEEETEDMEEEIKGVKEEVEDVDEKAGDAEEETEEVEDEKSRDGSPNVKVERTEESPEPGDEYDEEFISIPVECDLIEESQETTEQQDSGSDYTLDEYEDSNDEDYTPRSRSRRSRKHRREVDDDLPEDTSDELRDAYKLFEELLVCAGPHFLNHPSLDNGVVDYMDIIEKPMWLEEIKRRFLIGHYEEVENFVVDLKLIFGNCYRYFGRDDPHTKKALRIEQFYSQKVAALPTEIRGKFLLEPEDDKKDEDDDNAESCGDDDEDSESPKKKSKKEYHSSLLERFGDERENRKEAVKNALVEERKRATDDDEKEKIEWEKETLFANDTYMEMKAMWEIPQISQILQLTRTSLCIDELPHYEIERMFLMPQSSKLLAVLMTSLLSPPLSRSKLHFQPPMPYSIWSKKLALRVAFWYKTYNHKNKDPLKTFENLGIECEFWSIMGDWNQLEDYEFYELSFHQRVWVIKSLCDFLMHHHKTMHDVVAEHIPEDQMSTILGEDKQGRQYLHFPVFNRGGDAVRVYRQRPHFDDWAPEVVEPENPPAKKKGPKQQARKGKKFGRGSSARRKKKKNKEYDFSSFISRNTYRMPYSYHAGRKSKKRRGLCGSRSSDNHLHPNSEKTEQEASFEENADCSPNNSPEVSQDGQEFCTRSRRSTRSKYQANYLDWSDSDDTADQPESKLPETRSRRAFSAISDTTQASKTDEQSVGDVDSFVSLPGSSVADDVTQDASLQSDDGASRSSLCKDQKSSLKGDDSDAEEDEDDDMPDISPTKIEEEEDVGLWMTKSKKETRRPRYDPTWLLQGIEDFELVADSVQGIRDLIDSFLDEDDVDLMHRINSSETKSKRTPEQRLKKALQNLVKELEPIELKLEKSARLSREKMYEEWLEWKNRGDDYKDTAELYWLSCLEPVERLPPVLTPQVEGLSTEKVEYKKDESTAETNSRKFGEVENSNAPSETTQSEDATGEGEGRHIRRSKRRVELNGLTGDSFWPDEMTDEESGMESDHDDSWEMPSKRKRKRTRPPRKRPPPKEGQEEGDPQPKKPKKKPNDKKTQVKKRLWSSEDGDKDGQRKTVNINDGLHSKLTLDKQGNLFITMSSGNRVHLEKDDEGRIKVPDNLPKFSVLNGKTLQQLFGENRVIPKAIRRKECSTTLFPALPLPTVYPNRTGVKDEKDAGSSGSQPPNAPEGITDPNVDVMKLIANKVTIQKTKPGEQRVYPPAAKVTKSTKNDVEVIPTTKPKPPVEEDIVVLSDGSDDSIELIKETTPTKPVTPRRDGMPRIQKVIGNAKIDLPATTMKNLSKSVTMSPVMPRHVTPTKMLTPPKDNTWKPVITNSRSLNANQIRVNTQASPSWKGQRQVISSISPDVQITTTRKPTTQRNLSVFRAPNQAFVPVSSIPARPAQSGFVPVNQFVPMNNYSNSNQFQPVNTANQFVPVNSPHFVPLNSQSMVQVNPVAPQPPRVRMLAGNTTITPLPPARAQTQTQTHTHTHTHIQNQNQNQRSPTLSGQIVLVNTDRGFSYAVKLADGGTIFLTPEQVAKIREANSGKLTTMVTLHTN